MSKGGIHPQIKQSLPKFSDPCTCQAAGLPLQVGDVITVNAGGGGGYGDPALRDRALVQQDVELGYISAATAKAVYGVG